MRSLLVNEQSLQMLPYFGMLGKFPVHCSERFILLIRLKIQTLKTRRMLTSKKYSICDHLLHIDKTVMNQKKDVSIKPSEGPSSRHNKEELTPYLAWPTLWTVDYLNCQLVLKKTRTDFS